MFVFAWPFLSVGTKDYFNYVPSPVRLEFNWERIWSREYVLTKFFDSQRHLELTLTKYVSTNIV